MIWKGTHMSISGPTVDSACHSKNQAMCHNFCRSRFLSLFGRCSAVDVTGLLAIADPFFMFHLFCLVFTLTWFQIPNYMLYIFPLFPPCPCRELFIESSCAMCYWCPCVCCFILYIKLLWLFTKFCSPALHFPATPYTHPE